MSEVQVLWPSVEQFTAKPDRTYIDIHGIKSRCLVRARAALKNKNRKARSVMLSSTHGMGKTLLVASVVEELRMETEMSLPLVVFDCSEDTKEHQLKGSFTTMPDGSIAFVPGPLPLAIHLANQEGVAVLCLEEISSLPPGTQKVVNSITDWRRGIYVPQIGQFLRLMDDAQILIYGTMNPSSYGGTYSLNDDLKSRFVTEVVGMPTLEQEKQILQTLLPTASSDRINQLVGLAKQLRDTNFEYRVCTRDLVSVLEEMEDLPLEEALIPFVNLYEGSDRDTVIDQVDDKFVTRLGARLKSAA